MYFYVVSNLVEIVSRHCDFNMVHSIKFHNQAEVSVQYSVYSTGEHPRLGWTDVIGGLYPAFIHLVGRQNKYEYKPEI